MDSYQLSLQIHELKERLRALAEENAVLRYERDVARSEVHSLLPKATPEETERFRKMLEGSQHSFEDVIADIERGEGQ